MDEHTVAPLESKSKHLAEIRARQAEHVRHARSLQEQVRLHLLEASQLGPTGDKASIRLRRLGHAARDVAPAFNGIRNSLLAESRAGAA